MATGQTFASLPLASTEDMVSAYWIVSQLSAGRPHSFKIRMNDLAHQFFNDYVAVLSVKSMAYESSADYALSSHDHDVYTSAMFIPAIGNDVIEIVSATVSSLTQQTSTWHLSAKNIGEGEDYSTFVADRLSALQPKIGQVSFMLSANTDYEKNPGDPPTDFIGWLPADGTSYKLTAFALSTDLSNVFSGTDGTDFVVPNLSGFFRIEPQLTANVVHNNGKSAIPVHSHSIEISESNSKITTSIEFNKVQKFKMATTTGCTRTNQCIHHGKNRRDEKYVYSNQPLQTTINMSTDDISYDPRGIGYSYPSNQTLKAYVYVGRSYASKPFGE